MKKYFLLVLSVWLATASALAIPAKRVPLTVSQSDGSSVTLFLQGDEYCHFYTTADGTPVYQNASGMYVPYDAEQLAALRARFADNYASRAQSRRDDRQGASSTEKGNGTQNVLVILAQYTDVKFSQSNPQEAFSKQFNDENYTATGGFGSARDYFIAQSDGKFTPQFDVYGPYTVSHEQSYYGGNDDNGSDKAAGEMISEALKLANGDVNFKKYDSDGNGIVDFCYVVYAGYGEAQGGGANTIWPHKWYLSSATGSALKLDGVQIDEYACSNELNGNSGTAIDGIGTICHEFSHCLGLPDFYDTVGDNFGMYSWSLMDYGCYNDNGRTPAGYTAYEKEFLGWTKIETLDNEQDLALTPLADGGKAYRIESSENTNEYYIIENIQQKDWNRGASGHGLLVTHVDYKAADWNSNSVNTSKQRMTIVAADNKYNRNSSSAAGDPYPGTTGNTELTDYSTPAATTNNGNTFSKPITEIKEENGVVYLSFMKGCADAPEAINATEVTASSFKARWKLTLGIESYQVDIFHIIGGEADTKNWNGTLLNERGELIQSHSTKGATLNIYNLEADNLYCYRVRCLKDGILSAYSNLTFVQTSSDKNELAVPAISKHEELTDTTLMIGWNAVEGATSYILEYEQQIEPINNQSGDGTVIAEETFNNVKSSCGEITRVLDLYTSTPDWRGQEVHAMGSCVRLGSEDEEGYLVTPYLHQQTGYVTIEFSVRKYSDKDDKPILHICLATDADPTYYTDQVGSYISSTEYANYYCVLGPLDTSSYIAFISDKVTDSKDHPMIALDDITIYWGDLTEEYSAPGANRVRFMDNDESQQIIPKQSKPEKIATSTKQYIDVEGTSYTFDDLKAGTYSFRVRAINGNTYSPFSDTFVYEMGNSSFEVNGMNYEMISEERKTVALKALRGEKFYEGDIVIPETVNYEGETYYVTTLADSVFRGCADLHSVVVPPSITFAGSKIFKGCKKLTYVDWQGTAAIDSTDFIGTAYNTLVYVNGDVIVDSPDVIIIRDGVADSITLSLNGSFIVPRAFKANYIEYVKNFEQPTIVGTTAGWETTVLPFDVQKVTHKTYGLLTPFGVDGSNKHFWLGQYNGTTFEYAKAIKANVPYIISFPNSEAYGSQGNLCGDITFCATNATVQATINVPEVKGTGTSYDFVPVYEKIYQANDRYMLNTYDEAAGVPVGSTFIPNRMSLRTFGAYMRNKGKTSAPQQFPILFETPIDESLPIHAPSDVYSIDGRCVRTAAEAASIGQTAGLQRGIYIINGHKVIIQ